MKKRILRVFLALAVLLSAKQFLSSVRLVISFGMTSVSRSLDSAKAFSPMLLMAVVSLRLLPAPTTAPSLPSLVYTMPPETIYIVSGAEALASVLPDSVENALPSVKSICSKRLSCTRTSQSVRYV